MTSTPSEAAVRDHRLCVAQIIQATFFPAPQFHWRSLAPHQQEEFLECADEILSDLTKRGCKL
jgi:hypothetical protein